MRTLRLILALLVSCGMLVTVGSGPAFACSCAVGTARHHVDVADIVVAGTLVKMQDPPQRLLISSADPITYTVAVDAVYKGQAGDEVVFESAMDGASCGLEGMDVGRRYLFFLYGHGETLESSLCGGTAPASVGLLTDVEKVTGPPTRSSPEPAVEQAAGPGHPDAPNDDDEPASPAIPLWTVGAGAIGLGLVTAGALWLRRRAG